MKFFTMDDVRRANERAGHHWFEPETMRFFRSRVGETLYGGRYFVSSEKGPDGSRRYSVREAKADGSISTVGEFQGFPNRRQAIAAIRSILKATDG